MNFDTFDFSPVTQADLKLSFGDLPLFELRQDFKLLLSSSALVLEQNDYGGKSFVSESNVYKLAFSYGEVVLTEWNGLLHMVNYNFLAETREREIARLKFLLGAYSRKMNWQKELDNGFGWFFVLENETDYATWAYQTTGTVSFDTLEFRKEETKRRFEG